MIEIIWEFVVKEEAKGRFELAYGPGGAWSRLFAQSPGYRGTTLIHDTVNSQRYLTIDFWDTIVLREQVLARHREEYSRLEADFTSWTESRTELGIFRARAEGTVRPRGRARRSKARETHRRVRRSG